MGVGGSKTSFRHTKTGNSPQDVGKENIAQPDKGIKATLSLDILTTHEEASSKERDTHSVEYKEEKKTNVDSERFEHRAITNAEKNLEEYRKQQQAKAQHKHDKQDVEKVDPVYKTSDVYSGSSRTRNLTQRNRFQEDTSRTDKADKDNQSAVLASEMDTRETSTDSKSQVSTSSNTHHSTFFEKRKLSVDLSTPLYPPKPISNHKDNGLKPVVKGRLGVEGDKIKNQLTQQGIIDPSSINQSGFGNKEQNIMGELRQVGIIKPSTNDGIGRYSISTGSPVRKPPPRVTQLPPLDKEIGKDLSKILFNDENPPQKDFRKNMPSFLTSGRDTELDIDEDFFGTFRKEKVGDAGKLKLKVMDLDIL